MTEEFIQITVRLGTVFVVDASGPHFRPGWQIFGPNWMVEQGHLPDYFTPKTRATCELLRAMGELTPQQVACANAALDVL